MRLELDQTGERLDAAIARLVPELSRSQAQRLLEEGLVTFEGSPLKKNEKSRAGMILDITLPEAAETDRGIRTERSSMRFCTTAETPFPASAGKSAPALSIGLTKTRQAS